MIVTEGEYKGSPVITFKRDEKDRYEMTIGVRKAKIVLENIDTIQAFFEKNKHTLKAKPQPEAQS